MAFLANCPLLLLLFILILVFKCNYFQVECSSADGCSWYDGKWVIDESYPIYNRTTCPFIVPKYNCQKNGRPDSDYLKYRWQPTGCNLARFNGLDFLKRFKGKHILFVGDSIGVDQWGSLICLLHNAAPYLKYTFTGAKGIKTFTIPDYDVKVSMNFNRYLVDLISTPQGKILKLDSIQGGKKWLGVDMLIFDTWHWWRYKKPAQPWDYVQVGNKTLKDIDRIYALKKGLATWATWVEANLDPKINKVFFAGVSPDHYNGSAWSQPKSNCRGQTKPILGPIDPGSYPTDPVNLIKSTLAKMKIPVTLLDITSLTLIRKDGHASIYDGLYPKKGVDCTHWCLPGVPDTWNQLLYNIVIFEQK